MKYLLNHLGQIERDISYRKPILLLDYDGTLTPIVQTPDLAVLSEDMLSLLRRLESDRRFVIGIISGRSLSDVKSKVGLVGIWYAGNHGMEIGYQNKVFIHPDAKRRMPVINRICSYLRPLVERYEGTIVEDKGLTASVHYRMVSEYDIPKIKSIVESAIEPFSENRDILLTHGKMVLEIRPDIPWDKGKAVLWLLNNIGANFTDEYLIMYLGDDRTDEDAFRVLSGRGITVLVSSKDIESDAEYILFGVDDVKKFLERLTRLKTSVL
ncbi:MAG: trehalose-phosphatase [Thermoplasmata archaeon]